jgi:hypothetical protein
MRRILKTLPHRQDSASSADQRPPGHRRRLARARRVAREMTPDAITRRRVQPLGNTTRLAPGVRLRGLFARLVGPHREAERILNGAARRLLAEQLQRDAIGPPATTNNNGGLHGGPDQAVTLIESQQIPVRGGVDRDNGRRTA